MLGDEQFAAASDGRRRAARAGRHRRRARACPTCSRATPPTISSRDRRGRRPRRRRPRGRGLRLRADVLDLDDDRGVPQPAARVGARRGSTRPSRSPSRRCSSSPRHRAGRVRERRARGGRAGAALGRLPARDVQVRARRGVHRRAADAAQLGLDSTEPVRVRGVEVSPRDVVAAVLPDPRRSATGCAATCAGTLVTGTGKDGAARAVYLYHVVDNERTMREYGPRPSSGRPRSTPWSRSS